MEESNSVPTCCILISGMSYCPSQCATTSCHPGCEQSCCTQSTAVQFPSQVVYQQAHQPEPLNTARNPWQCPFSCTHSGNYCPPYCSVSCCKRRSRVKILYTRFNLEFQCLLHRFAIEAHPRTLSISSSYLRIVIVEWLLKFFLKKEFVLSL